MASAANFSSHPRGVSKQTFTPWAAPGSLWLESRKDVEKLADAIAQTTLKNVRPTIFVPIDPHASPAHHAVASPYSPALASLNSSPSSIASTPSLLRPSPLLAPSPSPLSSPEVSPFPAEGSPSLSALAAASPVAPSPMPVSQFPMKQFLISLREALHPLREQGGLSSPLTMQDVEIIKLFYDHCLPKIMNMTDVNRQPITRIPSGYVFSIDSIAFVLPRTVEIMDNLLGTGRTPYLVLNKKAIDQNETEVKLNAEDVLDRPIGKGKFKKVKLCIDLNTGILRARATMREDRMGLNEIGFISVLNGRKGILPTLGILKFDSKKLDQSKQPIKKIAMITPYCRLGCLYDFLITNKIQTLFPNKIAQKRQRINLIRSGLEGLASMHEGVSSHIGDIIEKVRFVHSDVKPENFIVSQEENGDLRMDLFDFGLSQRVGIRRDANGSPMYLPIELIKSFMYNTKAYVYRPANDMWAFAITAYAINHAAFPCVLPSDQDFFGEFRERMLKRDKEWRAKKQAAREKESFLDPMPKFNRKDPINFIASQCMLMDHTNRMTAEEALEFLNGFTD